MDYNVDDITGAKRPRKRLMGRVLAVVLPVLAIAAGAGWFVRTYVIPPSAAIFSGEPPPSSAAAAPNVPQQTSETTGSAQPLAQSPWPQQPAVRYSSNSTEVWASVPLPGPPRIPPREPEPGPPAPASAPAAPFEGPVPLPPRRPRISAANLDGEVPLPRPRSASGSN
jgi:hypothetical protein